MLARILSHVRHNAVAYLALFAALGGTSYAAAKINGKNLKNRSVAGKKLKNNTVTGKQVRESKLKKVPKAKQADNAATADNATQLGGVDRAGFQGASKWALVAANGDVLAGSTGVTVTHPFTGGYYLDFGSDVTSRPILTTLKYSSKGIATAAPCGGAGTPGGILCLAAGTNDANHAFVQTTDLNGASTNLPFYVSVQAP